MGGKQFRKAFRLYRSKKYTKVIQMLEPQVFRFRESFNFFYLLGMACLQTGDTGGAYSYLSRAHDLNPKDVNTLLGLSVIYLKKQETQKALSTWFLVLDREPNNKTAQRGLKILRKYSDPESLIDFIESGKLSKIMPAPMIAGIIMKKILIIAVSIMLLSASVYFSYRFIISIQSNQQRSGIKSLDIQASVTANTENTYIYFFTKKELVKEIKKLKDYFNNFEDNRAMFEINRILLSNADKKVKNQVLILRNYLKPPTFSSISTDYSYKDVMNNPMLYENCFVVWKGRVSNLVIAENVIAFDLLVGYEEGKILEGIVPVKLDFAVKIDNSLAIEVLGQIVYSDSKLVLRGISIHQFQ